MMTPTQYESGSGGVVLADSGSFDFGCGVGRPFAALFTLAFLSLFAFPLGDRSEQCGVFHSVAVSLSVACFGLWFWSRSEAEYRDYKKGLLQYRDYCRSQGEDISLEVS